MLFRNKKTTEQRRTRQPVVRGGTSPNPVFSYHARSARSTTPGAGRRSTISLLSSTDEQPTLRRKHAGWPKRTVYITLGIIVAITLIASNLGLSRDPQIIPLAETENRHIFLHSQETYYQAAQSLLASSWANSNKLTIDAKHISRMMQEQFPELESVTVTTPFFGKRPQLYIRPAKPALLLKATDGGVFVVDTAGRALVNASQVAGVEKLGLPLVEDESGLQASLGHNALPSSNVAFITEVFGQLKAKKIPVAAMILPKTAASELDVRVSNLPYLVKFNLHGEARAEAGAYLAVKRYLERENKTPQSYVDVRVENKVYYK